VWPLFTDIPRHVIPIQSISQVLVGIVTSGSEAQFRPLSKTQRQGRRVRACEVLSGGFKWIRAVEHHLLAGPIRRHELPLALIVT